MKFVLYDARKRAYVKDIGERLVSSTYFTLTTKQLKRAYVFENNDPKRLEHYRKLLKYSDNELNYHLIGE